MTGREKGGEQVRVYRAYCMEFFLGNNLSNIVISCMFSLYNSRASRFEGAFAESPSPVELVPFYKLRKKNHALLSNAQNTYCAPRSEWTGVWIGVIFLENKKNEMDDQQDLHTILGYLGKDNWNYRAPRREIGLVFDQLRNCHAIYGDKFRTIFILDVN